MPARKEDVNGTLCAGCGARIGGDRRTCAVCGKRAGEGFHPLDTIRSSYNLQGKALPSSGPIEGDSLFRRPGNSISDTAWACTVFSMVPYLGILFVPVAIAIGGFGYLTTARAEGDDSRRALLTSIGVSALLLVVQIIFWWLLYLIPEIGI